MLLEDFLIIAGPCQIEDYTLMSEIAHFLKDLSQSYPFQFIYKSSFDKANRTSLNGQRGVGLSKGLDIFSKIKADFRFKVLTDIHTVEQADAVKDVVDILQIPAFLCRQTDLLIAAGETGRIINVKKGQFLAPNDIKFVIEKIVHTGNEIILLSERGTCFGYHDLVVDMRSLQIMQSSGFPVIFDATHSVQSMGGNSGKSGGQKAFSHSLIRAATAVGCNGIFAEVHPNPAAAPSDGATMLNFAEFERAVNEIAIIRKSYLECQKFTEGENLDNQLQLARRFKNILTILK
jgi:2-dehydro-3-deoxyphosphooctonate aldolase (KDO 8-P synthase)